MRTVDFAGFNRSLENSSILDLDELSKNPQNEDRFMRFLRYIEILAENDQRKIEGQKLISRIFDLEKFKTY